MTMILSQYSGASFEPARLWSQHDLDGSLEKPGQRFASISRRITVLCQDWLASGLVLRYRAAHRIFAQVDIA